MDNENINSHQNSQNINDEMEKPIEGASQNPPQFKITAKMHNTDESPYETGKNGRFAFGKSGDAMEESNHT